MAETKKFLDQEGVSTLWAQAAAEVAAKVKVEADRAKEAEKALGERIDDIDFIDGDELADAIKDFETKENVAKVADDLADYIDSNDSALAGVKATAEEALEAATGATASATASANAAAASAAEALASQNAAAQSAVDANAAKEAAVNAKTAAVTAQETAEGARDAAQAAQGAAEGARDVAAQHKADAEAAKGAAETARDAAKKSVDELDLGLSVIDGQINIEFEEEL